MILLCISYLVKYLLDRPCMHISAIVYVYFQGEKKLLSCPSTGISFISSLYNLLSNSYVYLLIVTMSMFISVIIFLYTYYISFIIPVLVSRYMVQYINILHRITSWVFGIHSQWFLKKSFRSVLIFHHRLNMHH